MHRGKVLAVLGDIQKERERQVQLWGNQTQPDGTEATDETRWQRDFDRKLTDQAARQGKLTWRHILQEEVSEAFAEVEWKMLRAELVQIAAVAAAWIEDGDRRYGH